MQLSQPSDPEQPLSPAQLALLELLQAEDHLPEECRSTELFEHEGTVLVLVDSNAAWAAWIVELYAHTSQEVNARVSPHIATAHTVVAHCPVTVVRGDRFPEEVFAA